MQKSSLRWFYLLLMLIAPLSSFAAQNKFEQAAWEKTESVVFLSRMEVVQAHVSESQTVFSADSILIRDNAHELKKIALQRDEWFGSDKFKHFGISLLLTVSLKVLADNALSFDRDPATFSAAGLTFATGFGKEVCDDTKPNNIFSLKDLVADLAGVLTGVLLVSLF